MVSDMKSASAPAASKRRNGWKQPSSPPSRLRKREPRKGQGDSAGLSLLERPLSGTTRGHRFRFDQNRRVREPSPIL